MKMLARAGLAMVSALLLTSAACAQYVEAPQGSYVPAQGVAFGAHGAAATFVDSAHGLPVNCITGCGGSGGGGSGLGGLANAAAPSYTEADIVTNLSFDLSGYQRVRAKQDGAWTVGVIGTFWQTTQPVSAAALPLPSGAATSALQTTGNTSLTAIATNQLANIAWADQDVDTLASSTTYVGDSRDNGVAMGTAGNRAYFNAFFTSNQAGTARILGSLDGSSWVAVTSDADGALTASTPLTLTVPVTFRYYRAVLVNSATSATITIHTSFTGA